MSPPIALKPDVAVGADEKKRVGDMRQVIARVGAWKLGSEGARYVGGGRRQTSSQGPAPGRVLLSAVVWGLFRFRHLGRLSKVMRLA